MVLFNDVVQIAAIASRQDPGVARQTEQIRAARARLVQLQTKHLETEHELRLAHLRNQVHEQQIRRSGLRLRMAVQLFIALVAILAAAGILLMLREAFTARSVIVESFEVAPALAARGVTGKVAAGGLLDELRRLQQATRADAAKRELANAWAGEITLEVPEAGISYSELSRWLKARFGHDVHIDGDLVQGEAGELELTVRGDGVAPKTFRGPANELDKLTTDAAGYVYAQSQPVLWAYYLLNQGRNEEAMRFSRAALAGADKADRPYLLNTWANATGSTGKLRESLQLYRAALELKSDYWVAHNNVINTLWGLGEEESAWKAGEAMRRIAGGRPLPLQCPKWRRSVRLTRIRPSAFSCRGTCAGEHRSRKPQDILTRRTPSSLPLERTWTAIAFAETSSIAAAIGPERRRLTRMPSRSRPI